MLILYIATIVMAFVLFDAMIKSAYAASSSGSGASSSGSGASSSGSGAKQGTGPRVTGRCTRMGWFGGWLAG